MAPPALKKLLLLLVDNFLPDLGVEEETPPDENGLGVGEKFEDTDVEMIENVAGVDVVK